MIITVPYVKINDMRLFHAAAGKKISLAAVLFLNTVLFSVAQNGIPIDVLKNDPYFRNSSPETTTASESDSTDSTASAAAASGDAVTGASPTGSSSSTDGTASTTNTAATTDDDSSSAGGTVSATDATSTTDAVPSAGATDATGGTAAASKAADDSESKPVRGYDHVSIPKQIDPKILEKEDPIIDSKVDIAFGYMAFYTYQIQSGGIAAYFDLKDIFGFGNYNPYGAYFRIERMNLPALFGVNGFGFQATWSPMIRKTEHYTLFTNMITANILFAHKVRLPHSRIMFEMHVGGGGMAFILPTFTYETGYAPDSFLWVYPEATAGVAFQFYITRHWGIDLTLDASYPFLLEVPFPVAEATIASGWHF